MGTGAHGRDEGQGRMGIGGDRRVCIVGAGLAGSLLACYLARQGFGVVVVEKRADPRVWGFGGGRSINLALSARGLMGLGGVGLAESVLAQSIPMRGRVLHSPSGDLAYQAYSKSRADAINSVSRAELNLTLIEAAAAAGAEFRFGLRCADIDLSRGAALLEDAGAGRGGSSPGETGWVEAGLIVGADGAYSAVRGWMQRQERFDCSQEYLAHGYKELTIPPAAAAGVAEDRYEGFAMEPHALHIWPRGGSMMIALPNPDRSFTCTCFWPIEGRGGLSTLTRAEQIEAHFERYAPDARRLMPTLVEDYLRNPIGTLVTVRCRPWSVGGRVAIVGDAAHAIVPFFGQGMNAAFEDCHALAACLERRAGDVPAALAEFEGQRKPNTDAIADLALENFIEMRDKTASRAFRAKKHAEHALHRWFPGWYVPLYYMVSFTTIPYHEARERAWRQGHAVRLGLCVLYLLAALGAFVVLRGAMGVSAERSGIVLLALLAPLAGAWAIVAREKPPWSTTYPPR